MVPGLVAVMEMILRPSSSAIRCPSAASESARGNDRGATCTRRHRHRGGSGRAGHPGDVAYGAGVKCGPSHTEAGKGGPQRNYAAVHSVPREVSGT